MKTILKFVVLLLMTLVFMTGCIQAVSPDTNAPVQVVNSQVFSAKATGELVWILDGDEVGTGKSYTYIVDMENLGNHRLVVKEKGPLPDSRTWAIMDVIGDPDPNPENICNGIDDDSDGLIDEDVPNTPTTCGVGACKATGELKCIDGVMTDTCVPGPSSVEVCDGIDNDCDGTIDNNIPCVPITCGGVGDCATGVVVMVCCDNGTWPPNPCPIIDPAPFEVCDGRDNDCDGTVDEDIPSKPTTCGVGACKATGELKCIDGVMTDTCVPGTPGIEVCDGKDNNCNDAIDDGIAPESTTCGVGECFRTGQITCVGGVKVNSCVAGPAGPPEACPGSVVDGKDNDCDGSTDEMGVCGPALCPTVTNVQASDASSGLPYVQITWDACPIATKYKVYRAIYEDNSAYELIGEPTAPSFKVEYNWKTDVDDKIGLVPRMAPDATMEEKTAFGIALSDFREVALPYYFKFKAPSFFKVEACVGDDCSPASDPEPGQAKLIHVAATGTEAAGNYKYNSEVAELMIPFWGYPGLYTLSDVLPGVYSLEWCGLDICAPSGGGYVLGRLRSYEVPIQVDVWYDNWKEVWAAHPNAYFIADGYMGGTQQAATAAKGALLLQGAFSMDIPGTHADAYIWFYTGGQSGHPNDGQMDLTVDGVTYTYELPVHPAGWISTWGVCAKCFPKPVRPSLGQIGTPVKEWHMPFSEFDTNGVDDNLDDAGLIDEPGEQMLCPDGINYSDPVCFSPAIP